ncbi:hypothetical protein [uncultured Roseibium sp.]|uniref:hypothetical protein n=1 Tax=uncultured Roseibium sp. TaxID=1936171 RepID=UPI0026216A50|nr:hypothetical protein [uncultured Roseibium sp.]
MRFGKGSELALFEVSKRAARSTGVTMIDATIDDTNARGLAYYGALGFATYRTIPGIVCKCFKVTMPHK